MYKIKSLSIAYYRFKCLNSQWRFLLENRCAEQRTAFLNEKSSHNIVVFTIPL